MTLNINRMSFIRLSIVGLGCFWCQMLIAPEYQISGMATAESAFGFSVIIGLIFTVVWLACLYAAKRGWLWVTGLFSWVFLGMVNTIAHIWSQLGAIGCPRHFVILGLLCALYLYFISLLGLLMPILNRLGLLAPEP